ncbi:MAG: tellurite resistance TerB family protein [Methanosarcinales archaeon]|jgi:hypothetical protein|nr:tellurite resistance TerB family protein [Methanosarcinales archaeon]
MLDETTIQVTIRIIIALLLIVATALLLDYISKKTGKDPREALKTATLLIDEVNAAIADGHISEEEAQKISDAIVLLKDDVEPFIDYIADSGILSAILQKIKKTLG